MNLLKSKRWVAIAIGILSGSALAAPVSCPITPAYSIITEGQTLQLSADCTGGVLTHINWKMDTVSVTGNVPLTDYVAGNPIKYTTPVGLGDAAETQEFTFTVDATPGTGDTFVPIPPGTSGSSAKVVVKPSSAVLALAKVGSSANTAKAAGVCGTADGGAVTAMPVGIAQCAAGSKVALPISGPQSFTWSCLSLTGGAEASCYAMRGYTVSANAGANGTVSINPSNGQVVSGSTAIITATPDSNFSVNTISGCNGTRSGNIYTTGPVSANCTVTASFTNAPVNGACGTASNSTVITSAPSTNLCTSGSATPIASATGAYTWGCNGSNGGSSTSATACQAPRGYNVTTSGSDANGSISASKVVAGGTTTTFTVSPMSGYGASMSSTCGGSLAGTTFTTGVITGDCSVTANFVVQTISTTDPGSGLWTPPNTTGRLIADQSGEANSLVSYVPGCLNGQSPPSSSSSGCALNATFTGIVAGTSNSTTFGFGAGNTLGLRYMSKSGAGATVKYFTISSGDGGNVGQTVKTWLSDSPTATYDATPSTCKSASTTQPYVITGPGYCSIIQNTRYYLFISTDSAGSNFRYQVKEGVADFN